MIGSGKSVVKIAEELALSSRTVGTYRLRTLQKLGMRKTADLMHYAVCHRLVGPANQSVRDE